MQRPGRALVKTSGRDMPRSPVQGERKIISTVSLFNLACNFLIRWGRSGERESRRWAENGGRSYTQRLSRGKWCVATGGRPYAAALRQEVMRCERRGSDATGFRREGGARRTLGGCGEADLLPRDLKLVSTLESSLRIKRRRPRLTKLFRQGWREVTNRGRWRSPFIFLGSYSLFGFNYALYIWFQFCFRYWTMLIWFGEKFQASWITIPCFSNVGAEAHSRDKCFLCWSTPLASLWLRYD